MNVCLTREVRCYAGAPAETGSARNTWAGSPTARPGAPFLVLRAAIDGPIDPATGYVCDIRVIDRLLRDEAHSRWSTPERFLMDAFARVSALVPPGTRLAALSVDLSPYTRCTIRTEDPRMVHLTQSFEFSAAHRLYAASLSVEENARVFGKCANPNGHGHNYVVEVTLCGIPDARQGTVLPLPRMHEIVNRLVIERFDHKHLNIDCPEFAELNPTVENIARVIHGLLEPAFAPARLARVRVWETPKTYAECTSRDTPPPGAARPA
jgi:6-pyruvoyltetrahydropterin/6-carboxytetrahydropterin synthase